MELISKEELRDRMYREAFEVDSELQKWDSGCWVRYKLFEKILDEIPTVESRPLSVIENRPKGEWIKNEYGWYYHCSVCKENNLLHTDEANALSDYCPHCGADMRGEE